MRVDAYEEVFIVSRDVVRKRHSRREGRAHNWGYIRYRRSHRQSLRDGWSKAVFCGRRENLGAEVEKTIRENGGEANYIRTDVRESGQVEEFVKRCVEKYGRIDVAFNNAGIEAPPKALTDLSLNDWSNVITTNLTGFFICLREELRVLRQGGGCIVNNASVGGRRGFAMIGAYGASKAGVIQLTRIAALENAEKNIRVNSISPGAVDAPMLHRALSSWGLKADAVAAGYPIKRLTTVEEMAPHRNVVEFR